LIQYEDEIYIEAPVLLLFGGDGTPWVNGLYAIAEIHSKPLELGYESAARGQYYKLEIEVVLRLERVFEKTVHYPWCRRPDRQTLYPGWSHWAPWATHAQ